MKHSEFAMKHSEVMKYNTELPGDELDRLTATSKALPESTAVKKRIDQLVDLKVIYDKLCIRWEK